MSIASFERVADLGRFLAARIPQLAQDSKSNLTWTIAVHDALKAYGSARKYIVFPKEVPFTGEYLCDFTLFEEGYGCRIACESQWAHWSKGDEEKINWAFDKLRGVKADIKVFIFEGTSDNWTKAIKANLEDYAQLSTQEAFLTLHWNKPVFDLSWWMPEEDGIQQGQIVFSSIEEAA